MEIPAEIIQETGLTETQVAKVTEFVKGQVAELETAWGAKANQNAEKIIEGAAKKVEDVTGIKREQGQKLADYLSLASENYFKGKTSALETKEKELTEKLKNAGHSDTLVAELNQTKEQLDKLKIKEAVFTEWEQNDYKGKYEATSKELSGLKLDFAFTNVKPVFPETVNKYEAEHKWNEFKNDVLSKYEIQLNNGEAIAVQKGNEHITAKLADLITKNEDLTSLLKGKQNNGFGSKPAKTVKIEGVPFEVPQEADSKQRTTLIKEYLASQGIAVTDRLYATKFSELNAKILSQKTA